MNLIAYTALRYGKDYYDAAIRSVIDAVDQYHVLYAVEPSHGHWSDAPCPDSEDELRAIAEARAGSKLRWHRGHWRYEGEQRDSIHQFAPDTDVILVLDADEVWPEALIENALLAARYEQSRTYRAPMVHFFRSMHRAILHDPAFPTRLILPNVRSGEDVLHGPPICHFGYAQRPEIVAYKWKIHGHLNELRRDVDWFRDVFLANRQTDCHPVGSEYWNPEPVNPLDYLPAWMSEHPYYGLKVIE